LPRGTLFQILSRPDALLGFPPLQGSPLSCAGAPFGLPPPMDFSPLSSPAFRPPSPPGASFGVFRAGEVAWSSLEFRRPSWGFLPRRPRSRWRDLHPLTPEKRFKERRPVGPDPERFGPNPWSDLASACLLPGACAHFVSPFGAFRLAVLPCRFPPESSATCWRTVAAMYPLGNCDLPRPETSPDSMTQLGTASNRSWLHSPLIASLAARERRQRDW
jgi:hypothetical protein